MKKIPHANFMIKFSCVLSKMHVVLLMHSLSPFMHATREEIIGIECPNFATITGRYTGGGIFPVQ